MTAGSSSPSSSSSCHSSMPERGRTSVNIKAGDFSRASLTSFASSAAKRKRMSLSSAPARDHSSSCAAAQKKNNMMIDEEMFDVAPRRRFKRRNSKCASMFYQMISPTTLLELQKIAGEPQEEEPGYEKMTPVPSLRGGRGQGQVVGGEEDASNRSWCTQQLQRQMSVTPRPTDHPSASCSSCRSAFLPASRPSTTSTHSILAEALRLSSSHLDEMASAFLVHSSHSDESQLADSDVESVTSL